MSLGDGLTLRMMLTGNGEFVCHFVLACTYVPESMAYLLEYVCCKGDAFVRFKDLNGPDRADNMHAT